MLTYLVVGAGYRAAFYGRIARRYPALFRAVYLCRSEEKAALMRARTGAEAVTSVAAAEATRPDFVVVAVNKASIAAVTLDWARRGWPVLAETPAGATADDLALLREEYGRGARIAVSEQYCRYPIIAAGLRAVCAGRLGETQTAYLSLCHDYHAASLLRALLQTHGEGCTIRGERTRFPVVETDSRDAAVTDGRTALKNRDLLHVAYDSGKRAVYDFGGVQYHSYLRARHLTLRGSRGEWSDTQLLLLDEDGTPRRELLLPVPAEKYRCLDCQELRDARRVWQPELPMDAAQDEFAIASVLLDMADYLNGGAPPYSLPEALEDAWFWLRMEEAFAAPWTAVTVQGQA